MEWHEIPGWFNFQDIYEQMVNRVADDAVFVEVGPWLGRSTAYMAGLIKDSHKSIRFYTIDTFKGTPSEQEHQNTVQQCSGSILSQFNLNMAQCNVQDYVIPIIANSSEEAYKFSHSSIDFVFIDGDHNYEGVKKDILAWYPKVKVGGYIGGHDFDWDGVNKAVCEIFPIDRIEPRYFSWLHHKKTEELPQE